MKVEIDNVPDFHGVHISIYNGEMTVQCDTSKYRIDTSDADIDIVHIYSKDAKQ